MIASFVACKGRDHKELTYLIYMIERPINAPEGLLFLRQTSALLRDSRKRILAHSALSCYLTCHRCQDFSQIQAERRILEWPGTTILQSCTRWIKYRIRLATVRCLEFPYFCPVSRARYRPTKNWVNMCKLSDSAGHSLSFQPMRDTEVRTPLSEI